MKLIGSSTAALVAAFALSVTVLTAPSHADPSGPGVASRDARYGGITNLTPPSIIGDPSGGSVLSVDLGTWSRTDDVTYQYRWKLDGETHQSNGFDPTFDVGVGSAGRVLRVYVYAESTVAGEPTMDGGAWSAPVTLTPARTTITASAPKVVKARKKFKVHATITDPGASIWGTRVDIWERKQFLATSNTIMSRAAEDAKTLNLNLVVSSLPKGTHKLSVRFSGMDPVNAVPSSLPARTTITVKVTKRGPKRR